LSKRGSLAMKHARAVLDAEGAIYQCAGQRVVWVWNPTTQERVPRSVGEDLLGCFDILAITPDGKVGLVQVTTDDSTSMVRRRQRKIDAALPMQTVATLAVWAWVKGKHFRRWSRVAGEWVERDPVCSPLLVSRARVSQWRAVAKLEQRPAGVVAILDCGHELVLTTAQVRQAKDLTLRGSRLLPCTACPEPPGEVG